MGGCEGKCVSGEAAKGFFPGAYLKGRRAYPQRQFSGCCVSQPSTALNGTSARCVDFLYRRHIRITHAAPPPRHLSTNMLIVDIFKSSVGNSFFFFFCWQWSYPLTSNTIY